MTEWRTGRKVGRTVYVQRSEYADDTDMLIGMMDNRDLADLAVRSVNDMARLRNYLEANYKDYPDRTTTVEMIEHLLDDARRRRLTRLFRSP